MNKKVKNFIERNIEYLENDLTKFFMIAYGDADLWYNSETTTLFKILDDIGIDYEDARQNAVHQILKNETSAFGKSKDPGLYSMPVKDFVECMLDNYLNLTLGWWTVYIVLNKDEFTDVNIFRENDMWIISRKD